MRKVIKRWPRTSPINSVLFCQQVHKAQNLWPFFWCPRWRSVMAQVYLFFMGEIDFPSAYWFTVRADGHERRRRRVITNLMLFFFSQACFVCSISSRDKEINLIIGDRVQQRVEKILWKWKYFEKQNFQIWYEYFKVKRIVVLFITISLLVGKQDESCVQVCWFQRLSLYERIKLKLFFFLKKWLRFIKMEIYKEASYEIFKCIVSLLIFFWKRLIY